MLLGNDIFKGTYHLLLELWPHHKSPEKNIQLHFQAKHPDTNTYINKTNSKGHIVLYYDY